MPIQRGTLRSTSRLLIAIAIFGVEVAIARYAPSGSFLRSSVGDILVIALIYFFIRGVTPWSMRTAFIVSLTTGFVVEFLQLVHTGDRLGLPSGSVLGIVLGDTFSWSDLAMYLIGGALSWVADRMMTAQN